MKIIHFISTLIFVAGILLIGYGLGIMTANKQLADFVTYKYGLNITFNDMSKIQVSVFIFETMKLFIDGLSYMFQGIILMLISVVIDYEKQINFYRKRLRYKKPHNVSSSLSSAS